MARAAVTHLEAVERYVETADVLPDNIMPLLDAQADVAAAALDARDELLRSRPTDGQLQATLSGAISDAATGAGHLGGALLLAASGHSDAIRERARVLVTDQHALASASAHKADDVLAFTEQQLDAPQRPIDETWTGSRTALGTASVAFTAAAHTLHTLRTIDNVTELAVSLDGATTALAQGVQYAAWHRDAGTEHELGQALAVSSYELGFVTSYLEVAYLAPDALRAEVLAELGSFAGFYEQKSLLYAAQAAAAATQI